MRTVAWFRGRDLRLEDQLALGDGAVIPLYILEPGEADPVAEPFRAPLLIGHLQRLRAQLRQRGSDLLLVRGRAETVLAELVRTWRLEAVRTQAAVEPTWSARDLALETELARLGVRYQVLPGATLVPPGLVRTGEGGPFRVFTPFARAFQRGFAVPEPVPVPALTPLPDSLQGEPWPWPEAAVPAPELRLESFLDQGLDSYASGRDQLDRDGTSRLSAELALGTLSVRRLWHAVQARRGQGYDADLQVYLNQLLWREFAHHTLADRPELLTQPFRPAWQGFPWRDAALDLAAWKAGQTGFPVVDAAARELLATGHVHNRARMIAASFLTKHLLLPWQEGEAHYRRYLADYDPANNSLGWQWCAGCGVDAQPWFRVFNPVTQGRRFDPKGDYVQRWLSGPRAEPILDLAAGRARFLATAKAYLG